MAYVVSILPRAERDLESIFLYIQADSSRAAHEWFEGLIDATQTLSQHPQRNPAISENPNLRHLSERNIQGWDVYPIHTRALTTRKK